MFGATKGGDDMLFGEVQKDEKTMAVKKAMMAGIELAEGAMRWYETEIGFGHSGVAYTIETSTDEDGNRVVQGIASVRVSDDAENTIRKMVIRV